MITIRGEEDSTTQREARDMFLAISQQNVLIVLN